VDTEAKNNAKKVLKAVVRPFVNQYLRFPPVTDQEQLPLSRRATKCPHVIPFREFNRGKRVCFALRWEIRKENGDSPWSEIQNELVL
jgi:hypothetical protein